MKFGYIASHIHRHTFEINEVAELLKRRPDTTIYNFYRPGGSELQKARMRDITADVVTWSPLSIVRAFAYLARRSPARLVVGFVSIAARSLPNPYYWLKNAVVFGVAMSVLADARRRGLTHLHANFGSSPATIAWLGKRMFGMTFSVTYHAFDIYVDHAAYNDPLKRTKLRDADAVISVHEDGRAFLQRLAPEVAPAKFHVIRIPVSFDPLPRPDSLPGQPVVLAAGNLVGQKGFDVLVRAAGALKRRGTPVRLRILGEGPDRRSIEALVRAEGIGDMTELPGYYQHEDFAAELAAASVFAVPSKVVADGFRDGIPTVLVEAWLAEVPVVASPVAGMGEVLVDEVNSLVFEPDDHNGLCHSIDRLLSSPELATTIARRGRQTAFAAFAPDKNVELLIDVIERAARAARGRTPHPTAPSGP